MEATGMTFDAEMDGWIVQVESRSVGFARSAVDAFAQLQTELTRLETSRARRPDSAAVVAKSAVAPAGPAPAAPVKVPVRCPHYPAIRRAYAIMRDVGLDLKADVAMRAAFSRFLGRAIESRQSLDRRDWLLVGNAIKSRRLAW
jgi:hypothetical protein